jgi:hypothetical protein
MINHSGRKMKMANGHDHFQLAIVLHIQPLDVVPLARAGVVPELLE